MGHRFKVTTETLSGVRILAGLGEQERKRLIQHCEGMVFETGQVILSVQERSGDVYFIVSGAVRVTQYSDSGKQVIFRDLGAGGMFGELSAIDAGGRSAHVHAISETRALRIDHGSFLSVLSEHPRVNREVMIYLVRLVRSLSDRVFEYDALNVNTRIHHELLRLARANPAGDNTAEIAPPPTDETFARRIGTNREAVNKALSKMRRLGLIRKSRDRLSILDIAALERLARYADGACEPGHVAPAPRGAGRRAERAGGAQALAH